MSVERVSICFELQISFCMVAMYVAAKHFIIVPLSAGKRPKMLLGELSFGGIFRAIHAK